MTIKNDIYDMAKKQGYEGSEPRTTTEAINVLADMLADEDVEDGHTIKGALQVLAPYVGGPANYAVIDYSQNKVIFSDRFPQDVYIGEEDLNVAGFFNGQYIGIIKNVYFTNAKTVSVGGALAGFNTTTSTGDSQQSMCFMPSLVSIVDGGFASCYAEAIYIGPDVKTIGKQGFPGYKGTINCAFSAKRGAELGAPWGADGSATINYDVPVSEWPM